MSASPKFRLFAGPNGSGKSTLINEIKNSFHLGVFINADLIEEELRRKKILELNSLFGKKPVSQDDWDEFFAVYKNSDSRSQKLNPSSVEIKEGFLIWKDEINSYVASIIASFFRFELLKRTIAFSFEIERKAIILPEIDSFERDSM